MAEQFVHSKINSSKVVIFSKTYCPFCTLAKEVFEKLKEPFEVIELDERDDGSDIQDALERITGGRTVPRVFVNQKLIGGGTDVEEAYKSGELQELLKK